MYRLDYAPAARKAIRAIRDVKLKRRIEGALLALREEPRPAGVKRLVGQGGTLRIRVGAGGSPMRRGSRRWWCWSCGSGCGGRFMSGWPLNTLLGSG